MVKNRWYAILESKDVKKNKLTGVTRLGERLILWRNNNNEVICLKDKCSHRGASLLGGKICSDSESVTCPFHGFKFDKSGKCTLIPANGKSAKVPEVFSINSYAIRESHDMIFLWWGDKNNITSELPIFDDLNVQDYSGLTITETWDVHYTRAIENQLDLVHVPFVHYDTIGRGNKTLVNGPVEVVNGDKLSFWVYNEKDVGQAPKRPEDLPKPDVEKQHISFIFPNIWQNWITEKLRVFVAFVPIDNKSTIIYVRTYQSFVKLPLIKNIIDLVFYRFSKKVLDQDKAVVETQIPIETAFKMEEKLIKGDQPIITFRKMRDSLLS